MLPRLLILCENLLMLLIKIMSDILNGRIILIIRDFDQQQNLLIQMIP